MLWAVGLVGAGDFSLLQGLQSCYVAQASYSVCSRVFSLWVKQLDCEVDYLLPFSVEVKVATISPF